MHFIKKFILIAALFCGFQVSAQHLFFTAHYGAAGYRGDLQEVPFSFLQARIVYGIGVKYEVTSRIFINVLYHQARVSGNDKYNPFNRKRNLQFQSDISEVGLYAEYNLFDLYEYNATPFFFAGVGYFKFNPYCDLSNGGRIYLSEFNTEGQGFFSDRKKYDLIQTSIPLGMGLNYAVSKNIRLSASIGLHLTNTDYLDDVSTTYIDKALLIAKKGDLAPKIAYKGDQLPNGPEYPVAGTQRGNPNNKDSYYFATIGIVKRIQAKGKKREFIPGRRPASVECPNL
jgi:hypothetical protein